MTPQDLRILCTALGFTAVVMQGEKLPKTEGALRATGFANLIEEFCHATVSDNTDKDSVGIFQGDTEQLDKLIERFKTNLKEDANVELTQDHDLLLQLYDRLQQRHRLFATDNLIADEILHLLNEEISFDFEVTQDADISEEAVTEKFDVQNRIANAIIKIIKEKGQCQPHDLQGKGFTRDEIARCWPMAYSLAQIELKIKGS